MYGGGQARRPSVLVAVTLFVVAALNFLYADVAYAQDDDDSGDFVNGEIVVKLALPPSPPSGYCRTTIEDINSQYGTRIEGDPLIENPGVACIYLLKMQKADPTNTETETAAEQIKNDKDPQGRVRVTYAEPNFTAAAPEGNPRHRAFGGAVPVPTSDSAPYSTQYAVGALNLSCAQGISRGANTTVAVLDTGVQLDHPVLSGSLAQGYDFVDDKDEPADEGNLEDDDRDGFTDEMTGHGTHVAGIVHLVAPETEIMPLRVLDSDGTGNVFLIAEAVQYAIRRDADVINMSLGSARESELLEDIMEDLEADDDDDDDDDDEGDAIVGVPPEGVAVVASAGNENVVEQRYPAAEEGVLGIASVGQDQRKSEFSNFGPDPNGWVDLAAPGDDIHSTFPTSQYARWDGTSMAAPFVAGQAALIRSLEPGRPSTGATGSVESAIKDTARLLTPELGRGHADIGASLNGIRPGAGCGPTQPPPSNSTPPPPPNTAPTIRFLTPGRTTSDLTPIVGARVSDRQTNLTRANIRLFVDGRRKFRFSYNASRDLLTYRSPRLREGRHRVKVVAADFKGKVTARTWIFRINR